MVALFNELGVDPGWNGDAQPPGVQKLLIGAFEVGLKPYFDALHVVDCDGRSPNNCDGLLLSCLESLV